MVDRYYEVYGEGLLITDSDGRTLASRGLDSADQGVATATTHALVDAPASQWDPILPWDRDRLLATAGVRRDGELVGAVVLAVDPRVAARNVAVGWLWVAAGCLAFLVLAVVVGRSLTRWVLRPLDGLERAVAEMTEGIAGPPADVAGPPELRHFTAAFNTMAQVVRASLDRQRRLVAEPSHQLRNPPAAVRLRGHPRELCGRGRLADLQRAVRGAGPF
jgi:signal transduction histidine kinase